MILKESASFSTEIGNFVNHSRLQLLDPRLLCWAIQARFVPSIQKFVYAFPPIPPSENLPARAVQISSQPQHVAFLVKASQLCLSGTKTGVLIGPTRILVTYS
jgi:hypothetical protein